MRSHLLGPLGYLRQEEVLKYGTKILQTPKLVRIMSLNEKTCFRGFSTRSHTNQAVQPQKMVKRLDKSDLERKGITLFM